MKLGIIGLGNMGAGMALSARRAWLEVVGHDPATRARAELEQAGVVLLDSLEAVAAEADVFVLSLPNSDIIEQVVLGEGGLRRHARPGQILLDTSTADPASTQRIARALEGSPLRLVDGPVSGGPKAAHAGNMTMLLGGDAADIEALAPVLDALTGKRVHVGPVGAGHSAKLFNNLLCGINLVAVGEAIRVARAAGLDIEQILDGVNAGSGRSGVTEVNCPTWILNGAFNSGFTMKLMRKDLRLAAEMIAKSGASAPLSNEALRLWAESAAALADDEDFNRIVDFVEPNQ